MSPSPRPRRRGKTIQVVVNPETYEELHEWRKAMRLLHLSSLVSVALALGIAVIRQGLEKAQKDNEE